MAFTYNSNLLLYSHMEIVFMSQYLFPTHPSAVAYDEKARHLQRRLQ